MPAVANRSSLARVTGKARPAAHAAASLALVMSGMALAAEPPATVEYRSAFAGYRPFDAQAAAIAWRTANDVIQDGTEGAAHAHGMRDMQVPMETAPAPAKDSDREAIRPPSLGAVAPHSGHAQHVPKASGREKHQP